MSLEEYLPDGINGFREYQEYAISEIIDSIETGVNTTILDAPTGFGKSLVAVVSALAVEDYFGYNSYIYTQTKQLQDQYVKEFDFLCEVKGRSNYKCLTLKEDITCDVGQCKRYENFDCPFSFSLTKPKDIPDIRCEYLNAKWIAMNSPQTILNYAFAMTDKKYVKHMPPRGFGIFDEAHNIEGALMSFLSVKITGKNLREYLGKTLPNDCKDIEDWIGFIKECSVDYLFKSNSYKAFASRTSNKPLKKYYSIMADDFKKKSRALKSTAEYIEQDIDNWVYNFSSEENYVEFKPINIQNYTDLVFGNVENKLLMSGSFLKKDIYCEEVGIDPDSVKYIQIPSIIPAKQRPIVCDYAGSMNYRFQDSTFPFLISKIKKIAFHHKDEKGLIHTHSYMINKKLYDAFKDDDRFVFHKRNNRDEKLESFKKTNESKIFVSPYCFEGVDFKYDQARWQIICKAPYPNIKDAQVEAKILQDEKNNIREWGWYHRQAALKLSQAYGRTNRGEDDFSVTYLLDSAIEKFISPETLVIDYFLEGVVDYCYDTELELVDISKIGFYGRDNIDTQRIIFNDIKDGYNTTNKLRRVYKEEVSGGSFREVKYAVDDMLRGGAIRYVEED